MNPDASETNENEALPGYVISEHPLVAMPEAAPRDEALLRYEDLGELSRSYGEPTLFAIARDPQTIFAYWEIDWPRVFADSPPRDQKVSLRLLSADGVEQGRMTAEPMAANTCLAVPRAGESYRVELGYNDPAGNWQSVATAETVAVPTEGIAQDSSFEVVTIPLHLQFQRAVDLFRASKYDGQALTEIMSDLQSRAIDPATSQPLTQDEEELLRATNWQFTEKEANERAAFENQSGELEQRLEQILGFGPSSPTNGGSASSRA